MTRWFNGMSTFYLNLDKPSHFNGSKNFNVKSRVSTAGNSGNSNLPTSKNFKCNGSTALDFRPEFDRNYDFEH